MKKKLWTNNWLAELKIAGSFTTRRRAHLWKAFPGVAQSPQCIKFLWGPFFLLRSLVYSALSSRYGLLSPRMLLSWTQRTDVKAWKRGSGRCFLSGGSRMSNAKGGKSSSMEGKQQWQRGAERQHPGNTNTEKLNGWNWNHDFSKNA